MAPLGPLTHNHTQLPYCVVLQQLLIQVFTHSLTDVVCLAYVCILYKVKVLYESNRKVTVTDSWEQLSACVYCLYQEGI